MVDLDGEDADAVFSALSSGTARRIVATLHEEPKTQSEIADAIETSVQNVRYHLDKLESAGLVEIVDTWYSSRGNEMKVYAPADGALIVSGDEGKASRLKAALSRLIGGVGVVALASLVVQSVVGKLPVPTMGSSGSGAPQERQNGIETTTVRDRAAGEATEAHQTTAAGDANGAAGGANGTVTETVTEKTATHTTAPSQTTTLTTDAGTQTTTTHAQTTLSTTTAPTETTTTALTRTTETTTTALTRTTHATTTGGGVEYTNGVANDTAINVTVNAASTTAHPSTAHTVDTAGAAAGLPPGLAFFLGGVSVLVVVVALWYWSSY